MQLMDMKREEKRRHIKKLKQIGGEINEDVSVNEKGQQTKWKQAHLKQRKESHFKQVNLNYLVPTTMKNVEMAPISEQRERSVIRTRDA